MSRRILNDRVLAVILADKLFGRTGQRPPERIVKTTRERLQVPLEGPNRIAVTKRRQ